jgi:hypothetical protein
MPTITNDSAATMKEVCTTPCESPHHGFIDVHFA